MAYDLTFLTDDELERIFRVLDGQIGYNVNIESVDTLLHISGDGNLATIEKDDLISGISSSIGHAQNSDTKLADGTSDEVTASALRTHLDDSSIHRSIDDSAASATSLYSSNKIESLLSGKADTSALFSGDYNDLTNTPSIPSDVSDLTDTSSMLFSGAYSDLTGIPSAFNADSILSVDVDDASIQDGYVLAYNASSGNLEYVQQTGGTTLNSTDDLSEGVTNLYYTDARVASYLSTNNYLSNGDNVSALTNDAGYLTAVPATYLESGDNVSELVNDAGFITGYTVTQADVTQHEAALTITESQVSDLGSYISDISGFSTDDLSEGASNLYFTDERVDDRLSAVLTAGTGITLNYNDSAGTLTITGQSLLSDTDDLSEGVTNLYFTEERVDDRLNDVLTAGTNITLSYDDSAGTLTIDAAGGSNLWTDDGDGSISYSGDVDVLSGALTVGGDISANNIGTMADRNFTHGISSPSGGSDGDIHFQYD